jgi:hypothetical protein
MVCELFAQLCIFFLPIFLLALVLVHLAEDGIFLISLQSRLVSTFDQQAHAYARVNIPRPEPRSRRSCEERHSRL